MARILLVEDDQRLARPLQRDLRLEQHTLDLATDGEEGWQYVSQVRYDVIILDVMLPRLDGQRHTEVGVLLHLEAVIAFCEKARAWLNLPLVDLGRTHFQGDFRLGAIKSDRLHLTLRPAKECPDKTDFMKLSVGYHTSMASGARDFQIDYTCLNQFVSGWEGLFEVLIRST